MSHQPGLPATAEKEIADSSLQWMKIITVVRDKTLKLILPKTFFLISLVMATGTFELGYCIHICATKNLNTDFDKLLKIESVRITKWILV